MSFYNFLSLANKRMVFQPPPPAGKKLKLSQNPTYIERIPFASLAPVPNRPHKGTAQTRQSKLPDPVVLTSDENDEYMEAEWRKTVEKEKYDTFKKKKAKEVLTKCANTKRKITLAKKKATKLNITVAQAMAPTKKAQHKGKVTGRGQKPFKRHRGYKDNPKL